MKSMKLAAIYLALVPVACAHAQPRPQEACGCAATQEQVGQHEQAEPAAPPEHAAPREPVEPHQTESHRHGPNGHGEPHEHAPGTPAVVVHDSLQNFENQGNSLRGVATASQGAKSHEVWRTSVAVGSRTPLHTHESEEIFIFLQGKGRATIGDQVFEFTAPATVIAPAGIPHQFVNIGDVPTDAIVVVGIGSSIYDADGKLMQLPWRK